MHQTVQSSLADGTCDSEIRGRFVGNGLLCLCLFAEQHVRKTSCGVVVCCGVDTPVIEACLALQSTRVCMRSSLGISKAPCHELHGQVLA